MPPSAIDGAKTGATVALAAAALLLGVEVALLAAGPQGRTLERVWPWLLVWVVPVCVLLGTFAGALAGAAGGLAASRGASPGRQRRAADVALALVLVPYWLYVAADATSGAWISTRSWAWLLRVASVGAACAGSLLAIRGARRLAARTGGGRLVGVAIYCAVALGAFAVNGKVRVGQYPVLHQCLALVTLLSLCLVGVQLGLPKAARFAGPLGWVVLLVLGVGAEALPALTALGADEPMARNQVARGTVSVGHLARIPWQLRRSRSLLEGQASDPLLLERLRAPRPWTPVARGDRPDVLLITVCTVRPDHMGFNGYGRDTTPNLDRLAAQSVVFSNAYTSGSKTRLSVPPTLAGTHTASYFLANEQAPGLGRLLEAQGYVREFDLAKALVMRGQGRPLLIRGHFLEPHFPYEPAEPRFGDEALDLYDAEIWEMDRRIGALVRSFPGAIVAIVSDHGEEFGEHRGEFHGFRLYDELTRALLLLHVPGLGARKVEAAVSAADLAPTLLELVGVRPPESVEAFSLLPFARGEPGATRPPVFVSTPTHFLRSAWRPPAQIQTLVVDDGWKLIYDSIHGGVELYDLSADPGEQQNLFGKRPERLARLLRALATYREYVAGRTGAPPDWFR